MKGSRVRSPKPLRKNTTTTLGRVAEATFTATLMSVKSSAEATMYRAPCRRSYSWAMAGNDKLREGARRLGRRRRPAELLRVRHRAGAPRSLATNQ
jgi:hypothetical protein